MRVRVGTAAGQVNGVSTSSPSYAGLAVVMLMMCGVFLAVWIAVAVTRFVGNVVQLQRLRERGHLSDVSVPPSAVVLARTKRTLGVSGTISPASGGPSPVPGVEMTPTTGDTAQAAATSGTVWAQPSCSAAPTKPTPSVTGSRLVGRRGFTVDNPLRTLGGVGAHATPSTGLRSGTGGRGSVSALTTAAGSGGGAIAPS